MVVSRRGLESGKPRTQLTMLVTKLPVRLCEPLEPFGRAPGTNECHEGEDDRDADERPLEGQQTSYLTERLATVSTACDNTRGRAQFSTTAGATVTA